jgi:DNA-binding NtrC family response regulator
MNILVITSNPEILKKVKICINSNDRALECSSRAEANRCLVRMRPDIVVMDIALKDGLSLDLINNCNTLYPEVPIVMMRDYKTMDVMFPSNRVRYNLYKPLNTVYLKIIIERHKKLIDNLQ